MNVRFKAIIGHVGFTVASKQITKVMNIRSITYETIRMGRRLEDDNKLNVLVESIMWR